MKEERTNSLSFHPFETIWKMMKAIYLLVLNMYQETDTQSISNKQPRTNKELTTAI